MYLCTKVKKKMYPLLFDNNLHETVWGGTRLKDLKGMPHDNQPIGESWEVSCVSGSESVVSNGELTGRKLKDLVSEYGAELVGERVFEKYGTEFPLLVKFIDAAGDLSIQVHPDDELAKQRHGKSGKTEMWYVMQAEPEANLYSGFSEEISSDEYEHRVQDGSIVNVLARHQAKVGDVFFIPSGRVHSICSGIMLCEIQQSSDVTYRLYDYKRLGLDGKPRQLHTELAKDALDFHVHSQYRTTYQPVDEGSVRIADCEYFAVNVLSTSSTLHRNLCQEGSFVILSCLSGTALITDYLGHSVSLSIGSSCLIPATVADFTVTSTNHSQVRLLEAWAR